MICVRVSRDVKWIASNWGYCLKGGVKLTLESSPYNVSDNWPEFPHFLMFTGGVDDAVRLHLFLAL